MAAADEGELREWFSATWQFAKQILPLLLVGVAGIMLAMDWRLGGLTLLTLPAAAAVSYRVSSRTRPLWAQVQQQIGIETSVLQESIAGIRVVKAFAQEAQQFVESCMRIRPKWAAGLPLNCESKVGASYGG